VTFEPAPEPDVTDPGPDPEFGGGAPTDTQRPTTLDFVAAVLLLGTVVLHIVAMAPVYWLHNGSLFSQPDTATLYSVLAAAWALALVLGLTGPHRTPVAAALASGIALTELGFRASDLGDALRSRTAIAGSGVWVMEAAWVVGALGAAAGVLAARSRYRAGATTEDPEEPHERLTWSLLVGVLAAAVAGAFLAPWDHEVAVNVQTGRAITRSLGNAFDAPWQEILGNVLVAAGLLLVPIVAVRMRHKAAGAAAATGGLLVLLSQLASAVLQVDHPAEAIGISPAQARSLGLSLSLKLTSWFTLDALAAYALFAAVMVWATLRVTQESSAGVSPSTPDSRSMPIPSGS
jgi:hypothetical protein